MPNTFAYIVLFAWPLVVIVLFRRLPLSLALAWSVIAGYLLLPPRVGIDLPMFPVIDKLFVPSVAAAVMSLVALRRWRDGRRIAARLGPERSQAVRLGVEQDLDDFEIRRGNALFWSLIVLLFASSFLTVAQNRDTIVIGTRVLVGLRGYDALSVNGTLLVAIIPFLLGRRFLAHEQGQKDLLKVLVLSALAYSVLALYEVRMSPQLNRAIYGFMQHSFLQHVRAGSYRPLVFLSHGLALAIFVSIALLSSAVLWRAGKGTPGRSKWFAAGIWLFLVLVLCRSLGASALALVFLPVVTLFRARTQLVIAGLVAGITLTYPALRGADLIPVERVHSMAESISRPRAASLMTRLVNEDRLLERASERPLAGWGGWGRSRVYNAVGGDVSTTDGYWVIVIGTYGWLGYIAQFGLLGLPLVLIGFRGGRLRVSRIASGLGIVLAVSLIDQIPNASVGPVVWLIAGSMLGRYQTAELHSQKRSEPSSAEQDGGGAPAAAASRAPVSQEPAADKPLHRRRPRKPT